MVGFETLFHNIKELSAHIGLYMIAVQGVESGYVSASHLFFLRCFFFPGWCFFACLLEFQFKVIAAVVKGLLVYRCRFVEVFFV